MHHFRYILLLILIHAGPGITLCQVPMQAGLTGVPVADVLNMLPENQVGGFALMGNWGTFVSSQISVGMMPFYGQAKNSYVAGSNTVREVLQAGGIQGYGRIYILRGDRLHVYGMVAGGMAALTTERTASLPMSTVRAFYADALFTMMAGGGVNYFVAPWAALELNASYVQMSFVNGNGIYFHSVLPTLGIQFFINRPSAG